MMRQIMLMKTNRSIKSILTMLQLLVLLFTMTMGLSSHAQTVTYIHTDGLGSPVAKSDAAGNLVASSRTRYEPYGMAVAGTATPTIGFTGHVNDADTGLTYMQQRYYDPVAGRFLSEDPVLTDVNTAASFNRYAYVDNNPYTKVDPDGRFGVLGAFIGAGIEITAQVITEGKVNNWTAVGVSAATGFVTGGVGSLVGKSVSVGAMTVRTAVATTASVGALANATGKIVEGELTGKSASSKDVAVAAGLGALGNATGTRIGLAVEAKIAALANKPGVTGHIGQTTQKAMQQGGKIVEPVTTATQKASQNTVDTTTNLLEKKINQ